MKLKFDEKIIGIYCIKNKLNSKLYIGKTKNLYRRKYQHFGELNNNKHKNSHLQNAVNKYGISNFIFEVIEICDLESLSIREYYWINFYETYNRNKGYNIEMLDENGKSIRSYESIEKMRNTIYSKKDRYITPKGKLNPTSKEVYQYDLDGNYISSFESCHIASEFLTKKEAYSLISKCARNDYGSAYGFQWRYVKYDKIDKCNSFEMQNERLLRNAKDISIQIIAINLSTLEECEYNSISEAACSLNISISSIARIVKGERKKSTKLNMTFRNKS